MTTELETVTVTSADVGNADELFDEGTATEKETGEPTAYEQFCARCEENGVQTVTARMYTRWTTGNVKKALKGLNLEELENRHIQYWLDDAAKKAETEAETPAE